MNVSALTSRARSPSMVAAPTNERHSFRFTVAFASAANLSINRNPRLWRVHAYSSPGFPNPTMRRLANFRLPIVSSRAARKYVRRVCPIGNRRSAIANALLLFSALGLVFAFLLTLADNFRLGRRFTFHRRHGHGFFLDHTHGRDDCVG